MDFRTFWERYPKKVAKADAMKAWNRLNLPDSQAAFDALEDHIAHWSDKEPQFIPHAATWIRGRRWEDELQTRRVISDHEFFRMNGYRRPREEAS